MSENVSPEEAKAKIAAATKQSYEKQVSEKETSVESSLLVRALTTPPKKDKASMYTRYSVDKETLHNAWHALPSVYKFFLMIYRLSPVRTGIIIAVFIVQGLLPALRLRTGGDFIRQVTPLVCAYNSCKKEFNRES